MNIDHIFSLELFEHIDIAQFEDYIDFAEILLYGIDTLK